MGRVKRNLMDGEDLEGYASFETELSADRKIFTLKIDSSVSMTWNDALLALATWLHDEAKELSDQKN